MSAPFGTVDVLILNAAQVGHLPWDEITVDDWDRMMDVNLRGAFVASLAAIEGMRKNGYGKIVTIGSVMATTRDSRALHHVTKRGDLIAFTRSLSRCEGENGIRVNCVIPGAIQVERESEDGSNPEATLTWMKQVQALKYRGQPHDIATAVQLVQPSERLRSRIGAHRRWRMGQLLRPFPYGAGSIQTARRNPTTAQCAVNRSRDSDMDGARSLPHDELIPPMRLTLGGETSAGSD